MRATLNTPDWHDVEVMVRMERADENASCIKLEKISGDKMEFLQIFDTFKLFLTAAHWIIL